MILRGPCGCKGCSERHRLYCAFDCGQISADELRTYLKLAPRCENRPR